MEINIFALKEYAGSLKVLYVEDDEAIKAQIVIFLKKFFPVIVTARDGLEGLEAYKKERFDIVITDIMMPHMDGIEMSRRIKEISEEQIIIVTSAYNETEKLMELINIGVDKFVMKPISNKPFLILLYNVAKSIHLAAANTELQNRLVAKARETQKILNFIDIPIAVIENKIVTTMNKAFSSLFGVEEIESVKLEDISKKIEHKPKYEGDIIELLEQDPFAIHKARVKDQNTDSIRTFIIRYAVLQPGVKYLLTFTDITQLEKDLDTLSKKLHTNPFTGLPNKEALYELSGEFIRRGGEFGTVVFCITNLEHVIAWHGKEKGHEVEKEVSTELLHAIENANFDKKPFIANFDKNFYVALCRKDDTKKLSDFINAFKLTLHVQKPASLEMETISPQFASLALDEHSFKSVEEYFVALKQKYEKIIF